MSHYYHPLNVLLRYADELDHKATKLEDLTRECTNDQIAYAWLAKAEAYRDAAGLARERGFSIMKKTTRGFQDPYRPKF